MTSTDNLYELWDDSCGEFLECYDTLEELRKGRYMYEKEGWSDLKLFFRQEIYEDVKKLGDFI